MAAAGGNPDVGYCIMIILKFWSLVRNMDQNVLLTLPIGVLKQNHNENERPQN